MRRSNLGVKGDSDTRGVFLVSSLLRRLVFRCCHCRKPCLTKVWSRAFSAFVAMSGCSTLNLTQNAKRFTVVSNVLLRSTLFAFSTLIWSSTKVKVDSSGLVYNWVTGPFLPSKGILSSSFCSKSYESWDRWSCTSWANEDLGPVSSIIIRLWKNPCIHSPSS